MDFDDSDLVFDFEADLQDAGSDASDALDPAAAGLHNDQGPVRRTVCKYWLKGLCMRGESCGYLHQYDLDRMPVCHFFRADGYCDKLDCIFKHNAEDAKECTMVVRRLLLNLVVGFGNIKSIIVRTSLQWLKDALLSDEAHGVGADEGVMLCEEGGEEKDQNCGPW